MEDKAAYFLKLRKGFEEITVNVPLFLKSQGVQAILVPYETRLEQPWADFGAYKMILYPFVDGQDGFERELTDHHRRSLGAALRGIHAAQLPAALERWVPKETFSPHWRESLKSLQSLAENNVFDDPIAAKLARFMKSKRSEITRILARTEELALELSSKPLEFVLCHTDFHGGNILIGDQDELYIVDWDNPLLAPKERDLMFIGGGIDAIWQSEREEALFYEGYGKTELDLSAQAYYRYERIIEDLAVIGEQLLLSSEGGADRERSFGWFRSNFEPGNTIEIADNAN
jgi:spectinomycin phosphotransferase